MISGESAQGERLERTSDYGIHSPKNMRINLPSFPDKIKVYIVSPSTRIKIYVVMGILLLSMPVFAVYAVYTKPSALLFDGAEFLFVFFNLLMGGAAVLTYVTLVGSRLTISPDGIEFYTFGYSIISPWANIIGYGSLGPRLEGLILKRPLTTAGFVTYGPLLDAIVSLLAIAANQPAALMPDEDILKVIPIDRFDTHWQYGEIGEQIRHYAPHLFNTLDSEIRDAHPENDLNEFEVVHSSWKLPHYSPGIWDTLCAMAQTQPRLVLAPLGLFATAILLWGIMFCRLSGLVISPQETWDGHTSIVTGLAISADGNLLVSGSGDGTIRLWDTPTGQSHILADVDFVEALALSSDGATLAAYGRKVSSSDPKPILVWDLATETKIASFPILYEEIAALALSSNGQFLACISTPRARVVDFTLIESNYYALQLWEIPSHTEIFTTTHLAAQARNLAFSPDGSTLAVGLENANVILIDPKNPNEDEVLKGPQVFTSMEFLGFTFSGENILYIGFRGDRVLWHLPTQQRTYYPGRTGEYLHPLAVSSDGTCVAADSKRFVTIKDMITLRRLKVLRGDVDVLVFSPDGMIVYSAGADHTIKVWSINSSSNE